MPSPTVEKTWFYNINNKQANGVNIDWHRELMFDIKAALINDSPAVAWVDDTGTPGVPAGIWDVDHSCDGVAAAGSPGDAVDRWVDTGDLIWDRPGDLHSWTVLNTGLNAGVAQILLDLDNDNNSTADTEPESIFAQHSWEGDFASGTNLDRPVPSVVLPEFGRGNTIGQWAAGQTGNGPDIGWHMMMSDDGEELRVFMHRNNVLIGLWLVGALADPPDSVTENMFASIWVNNVNTTPVEIGGLDQSTSWLHQGSSIVVEPKVVTRTGNLVKLMYLGFQSEASANESIWRNDDLGGQADELEGEQVFGDISCWDVDSVGFRGPVGRIKDLWIVKSDRNIGDTYPNDGSRLFHQVGENLAVPWPGIIPQNAF